MTDLVEMALIAATPPTIGTIGAIILGFINRAKISKTSNTVEEVRETGQQTHKLVDGTLAIQYQINATSARALANLTKLPEHIILANAADLKLKDHLAQLAEMGLRQGAE